MHRLRYLASACALLFVCPVSRAQEQCGVEVKLLLAQAAIQAAIPALRAKTRSLTHVYFFDTDRLDLLSQGVILRLRSGVDAELTVKIRHPQGKAFSDPSAGQEKFKCEVDFVGGRGIPSYSLQSSYPKPSVPDSGEGLFQSLSEPQRELLKEAQVSIDWRRVKRIQRVVTTLAPAAQALGFPNAPAGSGGAVMTVAPAEAAWIAVTSVEESSTTMIGRPARLATTRLI